MSVFQMNQLRILGFSNYNVLEKILIVDTLVSAACSMAKGGGQIGQSG